MTRYAYRTEGVPDKALAACSPIPAVNPTASSWGLVAVAGAPGTLRVPSPRPQGIPAGPLPRSAQGSSQAPDYFLPSLYVTDVARGNVPPGSGVGQFLRHNSSNELPIPAVSTHQPYAPWSASVVSAAPAVPAIAQRSRKIGGRRVTAWPRVSPTWPTYTGGTG